MIGLVLLTQRSAFAQIQVQSLSQPQTQTATRASKILTPELGLYVDSTRRMDVEDVSRQAFTPFKLLLNRSLEPTTRWLKIQVQVPVGQQSPLMLVIGPYFLAELELYYEEGGRWVKQLGGAKHPALQLNCSIGRHCFTLPDSGSSQRVYLLRVNTINGFYVSTQVLELDRFVDDTSTKGLLHGVQIGIMLTLIGWSAIYLIRFRTLLVGLFCLTQISALFLHCFANGMTLRQFIAESPDSYAPILTIAFCLRLMFATCLILELVRRWQTRPWFRHYCLLWVTFWLVQIGLIFFGQINVLLLTKLKN